MNVSAWRVRLALEAKRVRRGEQALLELGRGGAVKLTEDIVPRSIQIGELVVVNLAVEEHALEGGLVVFRGRGGKLDEVVVKRQVPASEEGEVSRLVRLGSGLALGEVVPTAEDLPPERGREAGAVARGNLKNSSRSGWTGTRRALLSLKKASLGPLSSSSSPGVPPPPRSLRL